MDRGIPAIICLAVVLAGCSGLPGDGGDDPTRTVNPRLNETPTRSPTPTATPATPPGIGPNGTSGYDLSRTHREALLETPHTRRYTARVVTANGTLIRNTTTTVTFRGERQFLTRTTRTTKPGPRTGNYSYWSNGSVTVVRYRLDNGSAATEVQLGEPDPNALIVPSRTGAGGIVRLFETYPLTVAGKTVENGTRLYVLAADRVRPNATATDRRNVSVRVVVTAAGVVRSLRERFTATLENGTTVHVVRTTRVRAVGTATVPRPSWVNDTLTGTRSETG